MIGRRLIGLLAAALLAAVFAGPAQASITIESFETTTSASGSEQGEGHQAGGHPNLTTTFSLANPGAPETAKNVMFNAPRGIFGNPNALTRCEAADFALDECPVNSQAGIITVRGAYEGDPEHLFGTAPVYDLVPQGNETARFSFIVPQLNIPIAIPIAVRTGSVEDYGLRFTVSEITQLFPLKSAEFTVWGMPGLKEHNAQRFDKGSPGNPAGCPELADAGCIPGQGNSVSIAVKPLTDNPTTCTGAPLVTRLAVQSYQDPGALSEATSQYGPVTGCEALTFNPVLNASLTTEETDSASGLNLNFTVPQVFGFTPTPSELKAVVVHLPPGLTINPDAADGQSMCTDAAANFGSEGPAHCPDQSKIGTVSIGTPALDEPLIGSIYIGEPKPGDQYRLFMIMSGSGLNAKMIGDVKPDPQTGQLTSYFSDLPQVPFQEFEVHLFASDRGLMATPTGCTLYPVAADFEPWDGRLSNQTSEQHFSISRGPGGAPCPAQVRPFNPRLEAGTTNPLAGAFSDFHLKLDRDDGDQYLGSVNFRMPPGFTGSLRGIPYCPEASIAAAAQNSGRAEQAAPSCPLASQVGTTNVAAGPGSHPFHAVGRMYLAGPYNGAPLSLVTVTPALAGPYDYGVVVVRVALHVNPLTAQVSAVSGEIPHIIGGIPIRMRSIQVNVDRPNFTINPTNCSPFSVDSQGIGDQGTITNFSSYFHAVDCGTMPFKPKMQIHQLGSRKKTRRSQDPSLRFDLWTRPGDANIRSVAVTLSKAFAVDQRHLANICSKAELASKHCAGRQAIGTVEVHTPLLDQPLKGPAYAVSGYGRLPHLAFILAGQVTLIPEAMSSSVHHGNLKTVVPVVPDAPIGHFRLTLYGGKHGYLINTRSLCAGARTTVEFFGQNGRKRVQKVQPKTACGKRHGSRGHHAHGGHRREA